MPAKRWAMWAVLVSVVGLTGCCSWCERNCPQCHAPAAQPCCYPAAANYQQPAPPPPPVYGAAPRQMNCTCTCNQ
jgi:hypothetical protein